MGMKRKPVVLVYSNKTTIESPDPENPRMFRLKDSVSATYNLGYYIVSTPKLV